MSSKGVPSKRRIAQAAFLVTVLNVLSKVSGFFRTLIIAMFFGASASTDANGIANALSGSVTVLTGPISTAFLPVLSAHLARGDEEGARKVTSSVITLSVVLILSVSLTAAYFAPDLIRIVGRGLSEPAFRTAVMLTRVYFPAMVLPLLAAYAKFVLNAHDEFNVPALSVTLQNLAMIAAIALLAPSLGAPSLALAFVVGNGAALLVQASVWRKKAALPSVSLRVDESTREVFRLALPLMLSSVFGQAYVLVDRSLASRLAEGSVAVLGYAESLRQIPLGLFVAAVTTVIYPSLSAAWAKGDKDGFRELSAMGIRYVEFICLPAALGLIALASPVVRVAFERGAFTQEATRITASVLCVYVPAIVATCAAQVVNISFYAAHETRIPVALGIGTALLNTALDYALVGPLGLTGLAVANSLSAFAGASVSFYALNRFAGGLRPQALGRSLAKMAAASAGMAIVAYGLSRATGFTSGGGSFTADLFLAALTVGGAGAVYLGLAWALKCEELSMFVGLAKDRLGRLSKKVRG